MTTENPAPWLAEGKQRQQRRKRQRDIVAEASQVEAPTDDQADTETPPTGDLIRDMFAHQAAADEARLSLRRIFGDQYDTDDTPPTAA